MFDLPENFLLQMQDLLKEEFQDYLDSFNEPSKNCLRINTNKVSVEQFLKMCPFELTPVSWCKDAFYYPDDVRASKHPYYHAGLYYLQEPSATLPAEVLPVEPGDLVLDGCAAPGGKATKLLNKLQKTGYLVANDFSTSRCQGLLKNLELFGGDNYSVSSCDLLELEKYFPETFDKILLDVPCSGQGMFRKDEQLIKSYKEKDFTAYTELQKRLIQAGYNMLKDGGCMVYSTCTFAKEEDEEVVLSLLNEHPDCHLLPIEKADGFCSGILEGTENCIRLYPHKVKGEGHFVALIQKGEPKEKKISEPYSLNNQLPKEISTFMNLVIKDMSHGRYEIIKDKLLWIPAVNVNMKGLRVLRSGLYVGDIKKNGFEPSTTFALALQENEFANVVNMDKDDPRVLRYLKCETINIKDLTSTNGWTLVCVDHMPLGWGKNQDGNLKNKYNQGWRY